jgi:hypothetical protein
MARQLKPISKHHLDLQKEKGRQDKKKKSTGIVVDHISTGKCNPWIFSFCPGGLFPFANRDDVLKWALVVWPCISLIKQQETGRSTGTETIHLVLIVSV